MPSPFETLGLLPSFIAQLSNEQIRNLAKALQPALQFVFHPDRTGDAFRSMEINQAVAILNSDSDIKDAKEAYITEGPGQREIRVAEAEHTRLEQNFEAVEENIQKVRARIGKATQDRAEREDKWDWIEGFYSDDLGRYVVGLKGEYIPALFLRHTPGRRFAVATPPPLELKGELDSLRLQDSIKKSDEAEWIRRFKDRIGEYGSARKLRGKIIDGNVVSDAEIEVARLEAEKAQKELDKIMAARRERAEGILELRRKIRSCRIRRRIIRVNEGGYVDGTGFRIAGKADAEMDVSTDSIFFSPIVNAGDYLVAIDNQGRARALGVLQRFSHPRLIRELEEKQGEREEEERKYGKKQRPEEPAEKGLAVRAHAPIYYQKNPFETMGLLPSLVNELSAEELRRLVIDISKGLRRVLHPDAGGDSAAFSDVVNAMKLLENPDIFDRARDEYKDTVPGAGFIEGMEKIAAGLREKIRGKLPELTQAKLELAQVLEKSRGEKDARSLFVGLINEDVFGSAVRPPGNPDARFLRRCGGMSVSVLTEKGIASYDIETSGFDVYAVSRRHSARLRLIGSSPAERFRTLEAAKKRVELLNLLEIYLAAHPVLYPKGYLISVKDNKPEVVGMIESIEEGKRVARRMANKLAKRGVKPPKKKLAK